MGDSKFDELLTKLGTGKWNIMHFVTASYWYFLVPPQIYSGIYLVPDLGHTCLPPEGENDTEISEDNCYYYVNSTGASGDLTRREVKCSAWEYDTSVYTSTLTAEFNLVCDKAYLRATYQSIIIMPIFSSAVAGYIADKYGRRLVVLVSLTAYSILCICMAFTYNFDAILCLRFFIGCFAAPTIYVLSLEVCEVKNRSFVGIVTGLPWAWGTMALGGIAYLIRRWRYLQLCVSLPFLLLIPALFMIDESPRWLILKGRHKEALRVLKRASRWNKVELPPDHELQRLFLDIQREQNQVEKKFTKTETKNEKCSKFCSVPKLLSTSKIRLLTLMLVVNAFISSLVFSGLSLSGNIYKQDPFLYIVVGGLMECPSYTITAPLIKWFGRKKPTVIGYFISGVAILVLAFISSDESWLVFTLAMLGKMSISGSFMIMFLYMSELFPTEVRLQGAGTVSASDRLGGIIAPYITDYLGPIIPWFPSVSFGLLSFVAGLVLLPLPETLSLPMLETIEDLESSYKKHSSDRPSNSNDSEMTKLTD